MPARPSSIPVLTGPTGSGKTALAVAYARRTGAVIISADSRQVYRHMDIGTAKPDADERQVPHCLIDVRNPDESYSAGEFRDDAIALMARFERDGLPFVIVGGSGFYLDALMYGTLSGQPADAGVRAELRRRLDAEGAAVLHGELARLDPGSAARVHANDHYRLVRALEINILTGRPVAKPAPAAGGRRFRLFALGMERAALYGRINRRVDGMLAAGLVDEVRALAGRGYGPALNAFKTVGYAEVFPFLEGTATLTETAELIKRHTRQYAKRQLTWYRRRPVTWLDASLGLPELVDELAAADGDGP